MGLGLTTAIFLTSSRVVVYLDNLPVKRSGYWSQGDLNWTRLSRYIKAASAEDLKRFGRPRELVPDAFW